MVVVLLLLLVAGVERRMSQRGKGDGPPPPMGFTDRGPCLQMALCKRSLFSSALSLSSLLLLVRRLIVFAAYLACLDWGVENHSESQREKRTFLPRPSDQRKMLRNILCYQISAV